MNSVARTAGEAAGLRAIIRASVASVDKNQPIFHDRPHRRNVYAPCG